MSPITFRTWRKARYRSQAAAGEALGKSRATIARYERSGVPEEDSLTLRLAMQALSAGLSPVPAE